MHEVPRLIDIPQKINASGSLGVVEASTLTGFDARRLYYLYDIEGNATRGAHAHKALRQFMICLNGSVTVHLRGADGSFTFDLTDRTKGILIPPGYWRDLNDFAPGTVVAVLASEEYDEGDYIRDPAAFDAWLEERERVGGVPYIAMARCHDEMGFDITRTVAQVVRDGSLIGGPHVTNFEKEFAAYCDAVHCVGCGNGLDALVLIMKALEIGAGDEVIVPANSFIASALAVEAVGATSVFVDCVAATGSLDIAQLEAVITPRTKAVMPVHLYGIPVDMVTLNALAQRHNLYVIEDAAQAHGARVGNQRIGGLSTASGFSFYPTKNLGALGDGGAVVTNDPALAEKIRLLGNYGAKVKYHHDIKGTNTRLDPVQAAVLSLKLKKLDAWNERRRALADIYFQGLNHVAGIALPQMPQGMEAVWHVFPVLVANGKRDDLQEFLKSKHIGTNIHYPIPIHKQKAYATGGSFPEAERVSAETLSLPLDPYHTENEIRFVCAAIREWAGS